MNSLEWRVKKLENKIIGQTNNLVHVDRILCRQPGVAQDSILEQLESIAKRYKSFLDSSNGPNYIKFVQLYDKYKALLSELDTRQDTDVASKAELVLAYEDELRRYMENTKTMAETADRVLNVDKWPDMNGFQERLDKLQTITKEQHIQSAAIDKRTEELIELYNEIIVSFKRNSALWNQKLEAYENEETEPDEDI